MLLPKSWLVNDHIDHVHDVICAYLKALDTVSCMSASSVSIAKYTEPANFTKEMIAPDCKEWKDACDSKKSTPFWVWGTVYFVVQAFALVRTK